MAAAGDAPDDGDVATGRRAAVVVDSRRGRDSHTTDVREGCRDALGADTEKTQAAAATDANGLNERKDVDSIGGKLLTTCFPMMRRLCDENQSLSPEKVWKQGDNLACIFRKDPMILGKKGEFNPTSSVKSADVCTDVSAVFAGVGAHGSGCGCSQLHR